MTEPREVRGYRIQGIVQGVGFRWWTARSAEGEGLDGRVWNRRDGSVEVHVGGSPDALARFEEQLAQGPSGARVRGVERVDPDDVAEGGGFEIVHGR